MKDLPQAVTLSRALFGYDFSAKPKAGLKRLMENTSGERAYYFE